MALRLLIAILILAVPAELPGCGPFLPEALFFDPVRPERPAQEFATGQLGILLPSYERFYQVIAYRYLTGVGLNAAERREVLHTGPVPRESVLSSGGFENRNPWLAARNKVPGVKPIDDLDAYREVKREGYFDTYLNCNDDAFSTAAATLRDRIKPLGTEPTADWIAAQDTVFENCSKGTATPPLASDPRLAAARAYQIASAEFYSEQYDSARQHFQAIAANETSPWHGVAPYLAARCLIRSGNLGGAENELQRIAADPALARWHAPAESLLGYVRLRLQPGERMHELAAALVLPDSEATISQDLTDYRFLFDKDTKPQPDDDLTDWIRSFQAGGKGALEKWRAKHTLPWLVAALAACGPSDDAAPELLAAASEVKPNSAAYLTVNYRRLRLLPPGDARPLADRLLGGEMPTSARNQFRAERMRLARDFEEFLRYAQRRPFDSDAGELKEDLLDDDSAIILDRDIPLALLKQAAASNLLPDHVRRELGRANSIRTLVLSGSPRFDEVFALLKSPGMRPYIDSGYGRYTKELAKLDPFRDNWWCSASAINAQYNSILGKPDDTGAPFLSAADREQAAAEWKKLKSVATGPNWLGAQTLAFAQAHPQDPRVPEALYLVVRATRYGCTDKETGDFSHRAFDLLHRRYPNSEWAKKTPYWFD